MNGVRVDGATGLYVAGVNGADVVFYEAGLIVEVVVVLNVVGVSELVQLLVPDVLGDVLQQSNNILLLLEVVLIGCEKQFFFKGLMFIENI